MATRLRMSLPDLTEALNTLLRTVRRRDSRGAPLSTLRPFPQPLLQTTTITSLHPRPPSQHRLDVLRRPDGVEVYQAKAPEEGQKFKGLGAEEVLVYQAIDASGDVGIWTRDLRARTNLQQPAVTRILKALEARHLVQAVRSVANGNRKVYMRAGLEPAREVTGGAWYTGSEFDAAFAAGLQSAVGRIVARAGEGGASVRAVAGEVAGLGLARVALREEDIATVLEALAHDGAVERVVVGAPPPSAAALRGGGGGAAAADARPPAPATPAPGAGAAVYREDRARARGRPPRASALAGGLPCGACPVAGECADGGAVSPATCVYFSEWLAW